MYLAFFLHLSISGGFHFATVVNTPEVYREHTCFSNILSVSLDIHLVLGLLGHRLTLSFLENISINFCNARTSLLPTNQCPRIPSLTFYQQLASVFLIDILRGERR